ncbi:MAG: hypothetical protein U1F77_14855 [Kiritimatiellia bacterium]
MKNTMPRAGATNCPASPCRNGVVKPSPEYPKFERLPRRARFSSAHSPAPSSRVSPATQASDRRSAAATGILPATIRHRKFSAIRPPPTKSRSGFSGTIHTQQRTNRATVRHRSRPGASPSSRQYSPSPARQNSVHRHSE